MDVVGKLLDRDTGNECLWFWCPGCEGYHMIPVSVGKRKHPGTVHKEKTWLWNGDLEAPTISPSVNDPGVCHFTIGSGTVNYCADSSHAFAGKKYKLPPFHW